MSHFSVLVIGNNPEKDLLKYKETNSTDMNFPNEYLQSVDITEECLSYDTLEEALDDYQLRYKIVEDESEIDLLEDHKYGYALIKNGQLIKVIHRTNPDYKWDYYLLGGMFSGCLPLKNGKLANQARLHEVDLQKIDITYAVVKEGKWLAMGRMGWFGCSDNDKDDEQWSKEYHNLLKNLPDNTLLSVYDCHI